MSGVVEELIPRHPVDQLHDQRRAPFDVEPEGMNGHDARMLELPRDDALLHQRPSLGL